MIYEPGLIKKIDPDMENPYDFLEPLSYIKVNYHQFTVNQPDSKRRKEERVEIDIYADKTEGIYEYVEESVPDLPPRKPLVQLSRPRILLPGTDCNATGTRTKMTTPLAYPQKPTSTGFPQRNHPKQVEEQYEMKDLHTPNVDMYVDGSMFCSLGDSSENSLSTIPTKTRPTLFEKVRRFWVCCPFIGDGTICRKTKLTSKAISNLHQVPKNIKDLTVSQIGDCLRLLNLDKHVDDFEEMQIDGALLNTLSAEMLHNEFGMSLLKATKFKRFCQGWRPKEDKK